MPAPINLSRYRKSRIRAESNAQAASNRVKFGRTKAEKLADSAADERAVRAHEGRRLIPDE